MKLYSRHQVFFRAFFTGIACAAVTAVVVTFIFLNKDSDKVTKEVVNDHVSVTSENVTLVDENTAVPAPVKVVNDNISYTQDEAQNISVYENCNEAVVNAIKEQAETLIHSDEIKENAKKLGKMLESQGGIETIINNIK